MRSTRADVLVGLDADGSTGAGVGTRRPPWRRGRTTWIAAGLIAAGVAIRVVLIARGWPATNSDEGIIGLMARHIAYDGERPTFYYGQNYMGPHQAYIGAALFHLFGSSLFVLRLGLVLLFACFLTSTYLFTRLIYGERWALICLVLLGLGSPYVMARELTAIGGYAETLAFSALLFLLAAWLVVTSRPYRVLRESRWRLAVWALWGLVAGTSLWSNLLVAPFVLMSGLVLVAFCWREVLRLVAPLAGLAGLAVGMLPLIRYNLTAAPDTDSLSTLMWIRGTAPSAPAERLRAIWRSVTISVPMMTGEPVCQANELDILGPRTSWSTACGMVRETWGIGYMLLVTVAILLAGWGLWRAWRRVAGRRRPVPGDRTEPRRRLREYGIHLALLGAAAISFWLYATSHAPVDWPGIHGRYLIGLLVATPAILWPLWRAVEGVRGQTRPFRRVAGVAGGGVLAGYGLALAAGTVLTFGALPAVEAGNRRDAALIDTLTANRAVHVYSDYWTCAKITFLSDERVICAPAGADLQPGYNRYPPYWNQVGADPRAAYAYPTTGSSVVRVGDRYTSPPIEERGRRAGITYRTVISGRYVVFLPN
jgi:hypothetical protein